MRDELTKAIIFDFDGVILDTETPDFLAWSDVFSKYNFPFPFAKWARGVGNDELYDPITELSNLSPERIDRKEVNQFWTQKFKNYLATQKPSRAIVGLIRDAFEAGLKLGIASNSSFQWVHEHLCRFNLDSFFSTIVTREDVEFGKPAPEVYIEVVNRMQLNTQLSQVKTEPFALSYAALRAF